jgi:mono/diheme cytochrome c family protein
MNSISLSVVQIQDITDYLSGSTSPPPAPTTGEGIYDAKCAACHGSGGTGGIEGAIIGAGLNKIQNSMLDVDEMLSIPLSDEEAQALATYLSE